MTYKLPDLPYAYDALEPVIDKATMEFHHDKHHNTYVTNLNKAVEATEWADLEISDLVARLEEIPEDIRTAVRNNGGGHYNHSLFWESLRAPQEDNAPTGDLKAQIEKDFGSVEDFQAKFEAAGAGQFGSGWAWLVKDGDQVKVVSTPNQDNPITDGLTPLLGVDVWEHAYYLQYQNRRADYLSEFWKIVDWDAVAKRFEV